MPLELGKAKAVADIVLCVDCTDSMEPCINQLKSRLSAFVADLDNPRDQSLKRIDWRMRALGFRDLWVDAVPWVNFDAPMVTTVADAQAQVDALTHEGGGDAEESALDALWYAAAKTEWRRRCTKLVVLFSDAAPKPQMHESTITAGAIGGDISAMAQLYAEKGIWLRVFAATSPVWDQLKIPKAVFQPVGDAKGLETVDFGNVMQTIIKTVSQASQADAATVAIA